MKIEPWQVPVLAMAVSVVLTGLAYIVGHLRALTRKHEAAGTSAERRRPRTANRRDANRQLVRAAKVTGVVILAVATLLIFVATIGSNNASAVAALASVAVAAAVAYLARGTVSGIGVERPRTDGSNEENWIDAFIFVGTDSDSVANAVFEAVDAVVRASGCDPAEQVSVNRSPFVRTCWYKITPPQEPGTARMNLRKVADLVAGVPLRSDESEIEADLRKQSESVRDSLHGIGQYCVRLDTRLLGRDESAGKHGFHRDLSADQVTRLREDQSMQTEPASIEDRLKSVRR